jgi:hypothetical protein
MSAKAARLSKVQYTIRSRAIIRKYSRDTSKKAERRRYGRMMRHIFSKTRRRVTVSEWRKYPRLNQICYQQVLRYSEY